MAAFKLALQGESGVIRSLAFNSCTMKKQLPREDVYISGYWKIGPWLEDEHQQIETEEG